MIRLLALLLALSPALSFAEAADAGEPSDPLDALSDADPLAWKAGVSKADLTLAEPFVVSVEIKHPAADTYELRPGVDFEPFGVKEKKLETTSTDPAVTTLRLVLQPFETGELTVPGLRFLAQGPDGARKLDVPPQTVNVLGVIDPAQGQPAMREDVRPLPTRYRTRWWPLAVVLGVVLAALAVWWWRRRARLPKAEPPPAPRAPADVEALARLAALEAEQLIAQGFFQAHYFRLTEIARDYLGRRYDFDALEMTTDELLAELRRRPTPGLAFDALADFLRACDLVKFARRVPSDGDAKEAMDAARTLVERTRLLPDVAQGRAS